MSSLEETPRKRKKGVRHIESYKSEIIRNARVKGQEYINWKGNLVTAVVSKQNLR